MGRGWISVAIFSFFSAFTDDKSRKNVSLIFPVLFFIYLLTHVDFNVGRHPFNISRCSFSPTYNILAVRIS